MKKLLVIIVSLIIIGLIVFFALNKDDGSLSPDVADQKNAPASVLSQPLTETYKNDKYRFSLKHPVDLTASSFTDETVGGEVVTVADESTGMGMQIVITPFDEELVVLTPDRIKKDQPELVIRGAQEVILGAHGKGVAFLDAEKDEESHRQIWFIASKHLYQITAPFPSDTLVQNMLNTWEFF